MLKIMRKMMLVGVAAGLMVTSATREAKAFGIPLLSYDIPRVAENVQKIMTMVMQVKAEVESHIQIIKQIQHGGFGAAAGMLFAKIENGDYERLFGSFADIGINWKVNAQMSQYRAAERAKCEKEGEEAAKQARSDATEHCQGEVGEEQLAQCLDQQSSAIEKIGKKAKKECMKKVNAQLSAELAKVRAEQYQRAMAKYAEAKSKMKAYNWLQQAGLSTTTFMTVDTINAIGDGRIGDAIASGSGALGRGTVAAGLSSVEGANALGYLGGVAGGITQDIQNGYGIWGKMGIGGSRDSGGSENSNLSNSSTESQNSESDNGSSENSGGDANSDSSGTETAPVTENVNTQTSENEEAVTLEKNEADTGLITETEATPVVEINTGFTSTGETEATPVTETKTENDVSVNAPAVGTVDFGVGDAGTSPVTEPVDERITELQNRTENLPLEVSEPLGSNGVGMIKAKGRTLLKY